ncbi:ATP-binding cassette domain-containing protein [Pusillimonas sp. TS35]|uniref:ABC transporter ATP-binding protein n=1 Tax=Paracandidimonas lactea TaxID=2895524 RepID=UPI00136A83CA|nr:ABC transporter ATP-binding protein [Paracandidimonas lactea]MYN12605.1 ATP-binding cassette domain-containing protein [Pusillimonas sp. TS35]
MSLLSVRQLRKRYGGLQATDCVDLDIATGELHAIIGPNGAGKSTLIGQLAGELRPDSGTITLQGKDITREPVERRALLGLARSYQITSVFPEFTAQQNVMLAVQAHQGHSFRAWQPVAAQPSLTGPAQAMLERVGLAHRRDTPAADLAHGEQRQLELAMVLAGEPRLLLLDEPMAGMSQAESADMTHLLQSLKGRYGIVLVEHDMDAVFRLADRVSVLVYGRIIATGDAAYVRKHPDVRAAYLGDEA